MNRYHSICTVAVLVVTFAFGQTTFADKDCQALMKQINDLVDKTVETGESVGRHQEKAEVSGEDKSILKSVESMKASIRSMKVTIDKLLDKLCTCCAQKEGPAQQPTPSTTDKVTDILKTIGGSVSIGIGGGGGDRRHHGEERHRTADKVPTSKKTTTGTSHKTVTSGCKCHPCTCSPCTCH